MRDVVRAGRRSVRVLFIAPLLTRVTLGDLWVRVPLPSLALQVTTLALLAEVVARTVRTRFPTRRSPAPATTSWRRR